VFHQFDIVIARPNETVAVECKFRGSAHIDQLFATHGKLVDYCSRPHGVFVTTARGVNDEVTCYALAHRIQILCLLLPLVEYMLECTKKGTSLARMLEDLQQRIEDDWLTTSACDQREPWGRALFGFIQGGVSNPWST